MPEVPLVKKRRTDLRSVDRLMTTGAVAGSRRERGRVIAAADHEVVGKRLLLEVALQAKRCIALGEKLVIDRAVRPMAYGAAVAQRFVLEDERAALRLVALETSLILPCERAGTTGDRRSLVQLMAVRTGNVRACEAEWAPSDGMGVR